MSLNKLVGGDCGGNNSLVQLSNIVSRDARNNVSQADQFTNEFMAQNSECPQTFNMNTLLKHVNEVENLKASSSRQVNHLHNATSTYLPWFPRSSAMDPGPNMFRTLPMLPSPMILTQKSNVPIQYISESEFKNNDVQGKAQEYVSSVTEDKEMAYNQFMSFMNRISAGELNLGETNSEQRNLNKDTFVEEMAEKYKDEWEKLSNVHDYWESESAYGIPDEYSFKEGNAMLENKNALELGKERLKMGDIPGAVLCFEAAAQQMPESAEAWYLLGTTQAENEQDPFAITALKKSLNINPHQLEAYITLAAAYTNENMTKFAYLELCKWLKSSPKYSDLCPLDINPDKMNITQLEKYVMSQYLKAAQLHPTQIDPDVQNAMGVIFNANQQYDKAVDCYKTALMISPDNAKLWNRLGATLANSERSEEAVEAYQQALNLEPGFIRARYNVGITCMNLKAHREAAEHFLVALNQQCKARAEYPTDSSIDNSSSAIWTTLRMVCSYMGEHDAAKLVDEKNLDELNKFFNVDI